MITVKIQHLYDLHPRVSPIALETVDARLEFFTDGRKGAGIYNQFDSRLSKHNQTQFVGVLIEIKTPFNDLKNLQFFLKGNHTAKIDELLKAIETTPNEKAYVRTVLDILEKEKNELADFYPKMGRTEHSEFDY